jgi:hypothetical protein
MPPAKPRTIEELEAAKKAIKEAAAAEIAAIRKSSAERTQALKASERRIRLRVFKIENGARITPKYCSGSPSSTSARPQKHRPRSSMLSWMNFTWIPRIVSRQLRKAWPSQ